MFDNAVKTSFSLAHLHTLPQLYKPVQLANLLGKIQPFLVYLRQRVVIEVECGTGLSAEADELALSQQAVRAYFEVSEVVEGERLLNVFDSLSEFSDHVLEEVCYLFVVHIVDLLEMWAFLFVFGDVGLNDGELASDAVSVGLIRYFSYFLLCLLATQHELPPYLLGRAHFVAPFSGCLRLVNRQIAFTVSLRDHRYSNLVLDLEMDSAFPDFVVHQAQFLSEIVQTRAYLLCFVPIGAIIFLIGYHALKILVALLRFCRVPWVRTHQLQVFLLFCLLKGHCRDQFELFLCVFLFTSAECFLLLVQL